MSLYDDLGVPRDASIDDIKSAFRKAASEKHPDKEGGSKEKFQIIQRAYSTLKDEDKRKRYDETGETGAGEPSLQTVAFQQLASLLFQLIEREINPASFDILGHLKSSVEGSQSQMRAQQEQIKGRRKKFETTLERLKAKKDNLLGQALESKIKEFESQLAAVAKAIETEEEMKKILLDYEYEREEVKQQGGVYNPFESFQGFHGGQWRQL